MRKISVKFFLALTLVLISGCFLESNADLACVIEGSINDINKSPIEGAEIKIVDIKGKWDDFDKNSKLTRKSFSGKKGEYTNGFSFTLKKLFGSETQYLSEIIISVQKSGYKTEIITIKVNNDYYMKQDIVLQKE